MILTLFLLNLSALRWCRGMMVYPQPSVSLQAIEFAAANLTIVSWRQQNVILRKLEIVKKTERDYVRSHVAWFSCWGHLTCFFRCVDLWVFRSNTWTGGLLYGARKLQAYFFEWFYASSKQDKEPVRTIVQNSLKSAVRHLANTNSRLFSAA